MEFEDDEYFPSDQDLEMNDDVASDRLEELGAPPTQAEEDILADTFEQYGTKHPHWILFLKDIASASRYNQAVNQFLSFHHARQAANSGASADQIMAASGIKVCIKVQYIVKLISLNQWQGAVHLK
jgi:hypothetical protein